MADNPSSTPAGAESGGSDAHAQDRLRLTGSRAPSEHIDGAWWPRSNRLPDELPELLEAVRDRLGRVAVVGYRRDGWTVTPDEVEFAGQPIQLAAYTSVEPPTVILIGQDGHHLTLRVIDPDTGEQQAREALNAVPRRPATAGSRESALSRSLADVARRLALHEGRNDEKRNAEILQWCEEASEQFDNARIQTFVPILIEHIVNNRIHQSGAAAPDQPDASRAAG